MPTKALVLAGVLVIGLGLVGCGSSSDDAPPPKSATEGGVSKKASDVGIDTGASKAGGSTEAK